MYIYTIRKHIKLRFELISLITQIINLKHN